MNRLHQGGLKLPLSLVATLTARRGVCACGDLVIADRERKRAGQHLPSQPCQLCSTPSRGRRERGRWGGWGGGGGHPLHLFQLVNALTFLLFFRGNF